MNLERPLQVVFSPGFPGGSGWVRPDTRVTYKDYERRETAEDCVELMVSMIRRAGMNYESPPTTVSGRRDFGQVFGISVTRINELAEIKSWVDEAGEKMTAARLRNEAEIRTGWRKPVPEASASLEEHIEYFVEQIRNNRKRYIREGRAPDLLSDEFTDIFGYWNTFQDRKTRYKWEKTIREVVTEAEKRAGIKWR